ncbi:acyl--CoA ligase [Pseudooceanicola sp. CBS1P-1]|uniref:AMP-binding protein n=1 Tax=Pseudooceanicola albus TaxID=2692189 RepID=A0A6L7G9T1_9RHOB|nr:MULTISPECIES: class I adenylate-forming enzyme family protein [Pseudooceanicola]MBT9386238.1 acyl--CoA ligase [Pseudooceanicola endophyticus]MXN20288.1 AMP-binding protein [Pseudooceanicola albus]
MPAFPTLLTSFLPEAARQSPDAAAIMDPHAALSYADLARAAARIAVALEARGVRRGDRVILSLPNSVGFCAGFWGILHAGAVAVPLHPETPVGKLRFILDNCTPTAILAAGPGAEAARAALNDAPALPLIDPAAFLTEGPAPLLAQPPLLDRDLAAILYTSGSTGEPKGVMLSHLNMTSAARSVAHYLGYRATDRIFTAVPMTFDYGLHQLTMAALTGASVVAEASFAQPFFSLKRLADSAATVLPLVPSMVPMIAPLAERFDLSKLRLVSSTAAALHVGLIDQLERLLPAATIFSMYGLTECHRCTYLPPEELEQRRGSVGVAIPNTELWVIDAEGQPQRRGATGELVIRGSTVMQGYWKNPEATARRLKPGPFPGEQVLHTGDICRLDEDGFLHFVSRSDDVLKIRGEKVVPAEVEAVLAAHPEVSAVCVLGESHPVHGALCIAHVAAPPDSRDRLLAWCRARLDPHAVPGRITLHDALPRNQNGKIDRAALRTPALQAAE